MRTVSKKISPPRDTKNARRKSPSVIDLAEAAVDSNHDSQYPLVRQRIHRKVENRRNGKSPAKGSDMKQHLASGSNGKSALARSASVESGAVENSLPTTLRASAYYKRPGNGQDRYHQVFTELSKSNGHGVLTRKELQLLELLSYGYENGDIADHFKTSVQAVKNMLRTANLKLGADNRTHAVAICFRNGWLPLKAEGLEA